ncbi:hypothetical protein Pcac1_g12879 [Phytophthora cactorum]|uniref:Uncharacterized protein n=2 Tax=Phytophthora cactorum TaxID=29920 RepID=A0A329S6Y8_9STRA|nr:hypothetical protein Pcac1_g12879 [Phytophthora cactorum]RAW32531.1 hypothetical protein PC110_g11106 [Phytophthora cactorum]
MASSASLQRGVVCSSASFPEADSDSSDTEAENPERMNKVAAVVTLQVDRKLSKPEDYPAWRLSVLSGLNLSNMAQLVIGKEPLDDSLPSRTKKCWLSRYRKANDMLISAISDEVLIRY